MAIEKLIELIISKPIEFSFLLLSIVLSIFILANVAKHPVGYVIQLLEKLIDEFKPGRNKSSVEIINAASVFSLVIMALLLLVGMFSGSVVSFFIGGSDNIDRWVIGAFLFTLFLLFLTTWFSTHLLLQFYKLKALVRKIDKATSRR